MCGKCGVFVIRVGCIVGAVFEVETHGDRHGCGFPLMCLPAENLRMKI